MNANAEILGFDPTADSILIRECFLTIQGEGPNAGAPAVFVRLGGCNLACTFCDTDYRSSASERMSIEHAVWGVDHASCGRPVDLVVITGGEPLRQASVVPFVEALVLAGFRVQIETSGSIFPPGGERVLGLPQVEIVLSPKTRRVHHQVLALNPTWKLLHDRDGIAHDTQGPDSGPVRQPEERERRNGAAVYFQPIDYGSPEENKAALDATVRRVLDRCDGRLSLQLHKSLGLR